MTNYERMKSFLEGFSQTFVKNIETTLHDASFDNSDKNKILYVYNGKSELKIINMDEFAQKAYTKLKFFPEEIAERKDINDLAMATVDGFIIDKNNEWFFIEFKNQSCSNARKSVVEKAYQNYFMLSALIYGNKNSVNIPYFDFSDPIMFAKKHITYILVVSEEKNSEDVPKMHGLVLAGEKFRPEYMNKLRHYLFKDAYVYLPSDFERCFVNNFKYA
ncbi:hypothetical protein [Treponema sp.]|uniref:hypothetical protein n=1 Tax=Treponema sp. TaxID=166 RepID=UPI0025EA695A|nr:hypothetical protein [Treponema sp.]MBR4321337.1 hypothetical protein [Treponema sp.]